MESPEELLSDSDSAPVTEAHIQHGHPPLDDPKIKFYVKWDEWAESSNWHHQIHRLNQWEFLIEPKIDYYYTLDEESLGGLSGFCLHY